MADYQATLPRREYAALDAWLSQFYQYQLTWMLEPAKRAACVKARQIGWSHSTAGNGALWGAFHGEHTTILSKGDKESKEVLEKARIHADVLVALGSTFAVPTRSTHDELCFRSGGRILALPSTGGRGFTGNLILDEFAYHPHPKQAWDAAVPAMRLGDFRLRVISTPNGVGNEFHTLVKRIRAGIMKQTKLHEVTIDDAARDGFPVDIEQCWEDAKGDPRLFDQLFRCKFLDGELQYIPSDLIDACSTDDLRTSEGAYFAGLDVGKTVDRTVLVVLRKTAGPAYVTQHIETIKRTDNDGLDAMVERAFKRYDLRRLCVDATGMGAFPAERMQKRFGSSKIEPVTFTLQTKEDLATALYTAFAKNTIRIPKTDGARTADSKFERGEPEQLREDIASLRRIITTAGNVRYDAPHTDEGHADRAWALALGLHAAMTAPTYARL
jgi:phage FluMu gp28-like protein